MKTQELGADSCLRITKLSVSIILINLRMLIANNEILLNIHHTVIKSEPKTNRIADKYISNKKCNYRKFLQ